MTDRRTLLLLRHAKSSWNDARLADHQRPLNDRGRRDAPRVGEHLVRHGLLPDLILTSSAKRARKTAAKVAASASYDGEIRLLDELYLAAPPAYATALRSLGPEVRTVLVVGHNPGLEDLVGALTGAQETLPTSALVHLRLAIPTWRDLELSPTAELCSIWRPRDEE
jgi:phosphohistidine phosphatase